MNRRPLALIAHRDLRSQARLQSLLQRRGFFSRCVQSCLDVRAALSSRRLPSVIFTGTSLTDGTWRDVLALARAARPPIDVVLTADEIGPYLDADGTRFYLDAMEQGAFDFVVSPVDAGIEHALSHQASREPRPFRKPAPRPGDARLCAN